MDRLLVTRIVTGLMVGLLIVVFSAVVSVVVLFKVLGVASSNGQSSDYIISCTAPGPRNDCYNRNQAQLAQAIQTLQRSAIYAVECRPMQGDVRNDAAVEACVRSKLTAPVAAH